MIIDYFTRWLDPKNSPPLTMRVHTPYGPVVVDTSSMTFFSPTRTTGVNFYHACKDVWRNGPHSIMLQPFPLWAISPTKFQWINGWKLTRLENLQGSNFRCGQNVLVGNPAIYREAGVPHET